MTRAAGGARGCWQCCLQVSARCVRMPVLGSTHGGRRVATEVEGSWLVTVFLSCQLSCWVSHINKTYIYSVPFGSSRVAVGSARVAAPGCRDAQSCEGGRFSAGSSPAFGTTSRDYKSSSAPGPAGNAACVAERTGAALLPAAVRGRTGPCRAVPCRGGAAGSHRRLGALPGPGKRSGAALPRREPRGRRRKVPAEQREGWEPGKAGMAESSSVRAPLGLCLAHRFLLAGVSFLPPPPVPQFPCEPGVLRVSRRRYGPVLRWEVGRAARPRDALGIPPSCSAPRPQLRDGGEGWAWRCFAGKLLKKSSSLLSSAFAVRDAVL